jgi:hypothetical protein
MRVERATAVAAAYGELVVETHEVAGGYIAEAWNGLPATRDEEMNIAGID